MQGCKVLSHLNTTLLCSANEHSSSMHLWPGICLFYPEALVLPVHNSCRGESPWTHRLNNLICKMEPVTLTSWDCAWGMHSASLTHRGYFSLWMLFSSLVLSRSLIQPSNNANRNGPQWQRGMKAIGHWVQEKCCSQIKKCCGLWKYKRI